MRQPGTITIIATINQGMEKRLRDFLKTRVDVSEDGTQNDIKFGQLGDLHFCAMFIIDADPVLKKPALLVIEATIDSSPREFLENLVELSPQAIEDIFQCCEGFPASSYRLNRLVVDYLMLRVVKHKTHYCGYPGRTVAQIKGEQKLRTSLRDTMNDQNKNTVSEPPTYSQIHRNIKARIRDDDTLNWAVEKPQQPSVIKHRSRNIFLLATTLVAILMALVMIWALRFWSMSPVSTYETVAICLRSLSLFSAHGFVPENCTFLPNRLPNPIDWFAKSLAGIFFGFIILWVASNITISIFTKFKDQRRKAFLWEISSLAISLINIASLIGALLIGYLIFLKMLNSFGVFSSDSSSWMLTAILIGLTLLLLLFSILGSATSKNDIGEQHYQGAIGKIRRAFKSVFGTISFVAYYVIILALAFVAANLTLSFLHDALNGIQTGWSWLFSLMGISLTPLPLAEFVAKIPAGSFAVLEFLTLVAFALVPFILSAIVLLVALVVIVFTLAQLMETGDRFRYQDCAALVGQGEKKRKQVYAREEHGYNTNQNHLISVVHVKKGLLRRTILRATFWVINLLAEIVFNKGTLGGIPTILSARWMLIDNGARIVFMTNYVGAWDSYINEFLDLEGVRGVNAIWSNTVQPDPNDPLGKKLVAFPRTKFLLWAGAENEKQFKSYIRCSQVETLVWYGAYPDLSVSNINSNSALRDNLFDELTTSQIDELASRL